MGTQARRCRWSVGIPSWFLSVWFVLTLAWIYSPTLLWAAKRPAKAPAAGRFNPRHETVELFAGRDAGQLAVRFIPKDSTQGRVYIENKTARPLNVRLPDGFGGVPVVAQLAPGGQFPGGGPGGGGGGNQNVGGGFNGGNNGNGLNNRNGFFNIPAEKVGELKVTCVCLEHGKPDPRAAVRYCLVPIGDVSKDPAVHSLVATLSKEDRDQRAAQAAAWHLANGLSWEELAAKRIDHLAGLSEAYFSTGELKTARELVEHAQAAAVPVAETPATSLSVR